MRVLPISFHVDAMILFVKAKPAARMEFVQKIDDTHFYISVKEPPVRGMANRAIVKVLAEYFNISEFDIVLKSGFTSTQKTFEIKNI